MSNLALKQDVLDLLAQKERHVARRRCRTDLFYLLTDVMGRKDVDRTWLMERCEEVQANPNGYMDLWARDHYKSTIITFAKTIQDILASHGNDPLPEWKGREATFGIFSHTRPIAKAFLRQIKLELETNQRLHELFPDILWDDPRKAPKWSEDEGITVKRKSNPKEATVEAWGLVDGQPTSKHFLVLIFDDLVTRESVTTPEMIAKTTSAVELSFNLGTEGGYKRFIGSRYHYNDTYKSLMDRGTAKPRIYPATNDGSPTGNPVLLSAESIAEKRRDMGPYTFGAQMLLDPRADETQGFREEWLRFYDKDASANTNRYLLVDPASGKRPTNDYTAMWVLGLGADRNYYILDMIRDRLNLTQRAATVMELHRKWTPTQVRYEKVGMQADIEHIKTVQETENYRFEIKEVGASVSKSDRIKRLVPLFEQGRVWLPRSLYRTNYEGKTEDLVDVFKQQEYKPFPVMLHDDMLDGLAKIAEPDMPLSWPQAGPVSTLKFRSPFGDNR